MTTITANKSHYIENNVSDAKALLVFAHGAGAGMNHQFLESMTKMLNDEGINVIRFNFPYMVTRFEQGSRRPPDRMPKLIDSYIEILKSITTDLPLFICGKSMGGRVGATLMNASISGKLMETIKGAICIGYPFHPQNKPEKLRLAPLQETQKKIIILQGDRDALGSKEEIEQYDISPLCELTYFQDGDHDLKPRVKSGHTHQAHMKSAVKLMSEFIDDNT